MAVVSLKYKSKQGTLTAPGDVDPGAMIPIQTVTVGSTSVSTITFSDIPQVYEHLQIRLLTRNNSDNGTITMRYNGDSGSNYSFHDLYGSGAVVGAAAATNQTYTFACLTGSTQAAVAVIDILDYANTNKFKTNRNLIGVDYNGSGYSWFSSGNWRSTSAITSITLGATFNQHTHAALYGIKRAGA